MKKTLLALLLVFALLFTLMMPTYAADAADSSESTADAEGTNDTADDSAEGSTTNESEDAGETTAKVDTDDEKEESWGVGEWISLGIGVVILVTLLVFAILFISAKDDGTAGKDGSKVPFRIRGKRYFRSVRSESKKVVWTPWKTVRKNTLVVLVILVVCAIVIGALDWVFSKGIIALASLF